MLDKKLLRRYASPGWTIPASYSLLHTEQINYIIRTAVRIIDHHKILILYIYNRKQVLQGNSSPLWTMFHSKTGYITLARCDSGRTKWRKASFHNLDRDYWFTSKCAFYGQCDEEKVQKYFHSSCSGISALVHAQSALLESRKEKRRRQRDREIVKRMEPVSAIPRGLKSWVRRSIMPAYFFYDYEPKKAVAGVCSACGSQFTQSNVKYNAKTVCPHCKRELTMKSRGRRGHIYDRDTCQTVQKISPGEVLIRIIKVHYHYPNDTPVEIYRENARIFLRLNDAGKASSSSYYYSYGRCALTPWKPGERPVFYPYHDNYQADTCAHVYCANLPKALSGTPWQYCPIQLFYEHYRWPMELEPFLKAHSEHPRFEHLIKVGFFSLATDLVYREHDLRTLDETQKRTHQILRVAPEDVGFLRNLEVGLSTLRSFQKHAQENLKDRQALFRWTKEHQVVHDVDKILQNLSVHKFLRYMDRQYSFLRMRQTKYGGIRYSSMQALVSEYRDYLEMCEKEHYDMRSSFVLFPKDLQKSHDMVAGRIKHKDDSKARRKFQSVYKRVGSALDFEHDGMKIICPTRPKDIVAEGHALHHCVGSYTDRVSRGECLIVFLRRCKEPDKSFYTIELRDWKIIQLKGHGNVDATPEVQAFVDSWKRDVLQARRAAA